MRLSKKITTVLIVSLYLIVCSGLVWAEEKEAAKMGIGEKTVSVNKQDVMDNEGASYLMAQAEEAKKKQSEKSSSKDTGISVKMEPVNVFAKRQKIVEGTNSYVVNSASSSTKGDIPLIETPQSISIITQKQLRDQKPININEALRYTPGVRSEPFGFETRFTNLRLRGFDATTTGLFRDGLQLRNPNFAIGYNVEPYSAERIEIPRGPASVLYGQGNPGGIINFVSKKPTKEPLHEVIFEPGNFDYYQGKFDYSDKVKGNEKLSYRLTALIRDAGTQVDFVPNDRIFFAPALTWQPREGTTLTFLASFQDDGSGISQRLPASGTLNDNINGEIPTETYTGEQGVEKYDRREYSLGYLFEHRVDKTWTLRQNLRLNSTDVEDVTIFTTSLLDDQRTITRSIFGSDGKLGAFAIDNQVQAKFATGSVKHTFLAGLDYQHIHVDSVQAFGTAPNLDIFNPTYGSAVTDPPVFGDTVTTQDQVGLYFQDQIKVDRLIFQIGGRQDWAENTSKNDIAGTETEQDDNKFTFRGGVVYQTEIGLAPYFSYSESFLQVVGTDASQGAFKPETGDQYEFGLKYQPDGWNSFITLAFFDLTRENVTTSDLANVGFQEQTGEVNSKGIELEAVGTLDSGLSFNLAYTYLDMEITSSNVTGEVGSTPAQTPDHMASLWLDYTIPDGALRGLGIGGGVRHIGSTFGDDTNSFEVPSVTFGDAAIRYDWNGARLALNVHNLADETYVASCFPAGQNFCTYGAKRSIRGTIAYRW